MSILKLLSKQQKEAIGILQVGTFLEYFDFMLYVHMAVLLNDLFYPPTDPSTASLLTAFAFCSSFVLRPFGALIFGYIGDNYGRKVTVIMTTAIMSMSCVLMANLPTYAQIGVAAAWLVTLCRVLQGLSSMGEIMGAFVYVTEITKPPVQYPAVTFISVAALLGASTALCVATLVTSVGLNWRIAFWIGAGIAVVGSFARTRLRETPDFVEKINARNKKRERNNGVVVKYKESDDVYSKKNIIFFFLIYCGWPLCFYLSYMYFNSILKTKYGYSSNDIILHNFFLSMIHVVSCYIFSIMSLKTCPLKILRIKGYFFLVIGASMPFLISLTSSSVHLFIIQAFIITLSLTDYPAVGIFVRNTPVLKRVTATSFFYALSRALMYIITSFSLVFLTDLMGHIGILVILLPTTIGYLWAVKHYEELHNASNEHSICVNPAELKAA